MFSASGGFSASGKLPGRHPAEEPDFGWMWLWPPAASAAGTIKAEPPIAAPTPQSGRRKWRITGCAANPILLQLVHGNRGEFDASAQFEEKTA
jgi:hypothetical protein